MNELVWVRSDDYDYQTGYVSFILSNQYFSTVIMQFIVNTRSLNMKNSRSGKFTKHKIQSSSSSVEREATYR